MHIEEVNVGPFGRLNEIQMAHLWQLARQRVVAYNSIKHASRRLIAESRAVRAMKRIQAGQDGLLYIDVDQLSEPYKPPKDIDMLVDYRSLAEILKPDFVGVEMF